MEGEPDFRWAAKKVRDFLRANTFIRGKLKAEYGLDGRLPEQLARALAEPGKARTYTNAVPKRRRASSANRLVRERIGRLASDIDADPEAVLAKIGRISTAHSLPLSDAQAAMRTAELWAQSSQPLLAVANAELAFRLAAESGIDEALRMLPSALYYAHRCGSAARFETVVRGCLIPYFERIERLPASSRYVGAALGQLACVLNERGNSRLATELFEQPTVRKIRGDDRDLTWCGISVFGNEAHCEALARRTPRRGRDIIESLLVVHRSPGNQRTLSSTLCRLHMLMGDPRQAWSAIEQQYWTTRGLLATGQGGPAGSESGAPGRTARPVRAGRHHLFESLLLGTTARANVKAAGWSPIETEQDIALLRAMASEASADGRYVLELGYGIPILAPELDAAWAHSLRSMCEATARPKLLDTQVAAIEQLARLLSDKSTA